MSPFAAPRTSRNKSLARPDCLGDRRECIMLQSRARRDDRVVWEGE
jgi:hypothetical protein